MNYAAMTALCVEDEPLVSLEMSKVLSEIGFGTVLTAYRLSAAWEIIETRSIDMAVLDYDLGFGERTAELGLALKKASACVLFVSGYHKSDLDPRLAEFPFFEKPAMTRALKKRIAELMEGTGQKDGPRGARQS